MTTVVTDIMPCFTNQNLLLLSKNIIETSYIISSYIPLPSGYIHRSRDDISIAYWWTNEICDDRIRAGLLCRMEVANYLTLAHRKFPYRDFSSDRSWRCVKSYCTSQSRTYKNVPTTIFVAMAMQHVAYACSYKIIQWEHISPG